MSENLQDASGSKLARVVQLSRTQVDRLGERLRTSDPPLREDVEAFDAYRAGFSSALREIESRCRELVPGARERAARLKTLESTVGKLRRGSFRLSQVQDIAGCRLVVDELLAQDAALSALADNLRGARVIDYRERPNCGYRAIHIIALATDDRAVEIQLRTSFQNLWANESELLAARFGREVKYCGGPPRVRDALDRLSSQTHAFDEVGRRMSLGLTRVESLNRAQRAYRTRSASARERALLDKLQVDARNLSNALRDASSAGERIIADIGRMLEEPD